MSDTDFPVTIWHNPACGTSRNVVAMVQAAGYEPEVVEYLHMGWDREELIGLLAAAGLTPQGVLREKGTVARELGLLDASVSNEILLDAMIAYPSLVDRPLVRTPKGVKLARPSETVLDLLDRKPESFAKEDGQVIGII